jgi:N-acetylglucosaminyldiphosphoundecaprenol N-acetyl-beta-D-mannosaminyltransferase
VDHLAGHSRGASGEGTLTSAPTRSASSGGIAASRDTRPVLGVSIDVVDWDRAVDRIMAWGRERRGRAVFLCNVHVAVTASRDPALAAALRAGDLVLPDGAPVAWMQRRQGASGQSRIDGPNLMSRLLSAAERDALPVYLLGGSPAALASLEKELANRFPRLQIAGSCSPPYREPTPEENQRMVAAINDSGAGLVFVGLGCPKQELWIARHTAAVQAAMLGVGAAFDFHAKLKPRAPEWMQRTGLEWVHRLGSEPRRLWKRYVFTNSVFVVRAIWQLTIGRGLVS